MAQNIGEGVLKLTTDDSEMKKGLDKAHKKAVDQGKKLAEGIGIAATAAIAFSKVLLDAWGESEDAAIRLGAAIKSTGQEGQISSESMLDLASQLQKTTRFSDDAAASAEALLISVGNFTERGVKEALPALADYAAATGVDLVTAAEQMAQAIEGGRNTFARFGIQLKEDQPKAEKFDAIIQGLNGHFAGTAETLRNSTNGALIVLGNALNDLQESGGRALSVFVRPFADLLGPIVSKVTEWVNATFDLMDAINAVKAGTSTSAQAVTAFTQAVETDTKNLNKAIFAYDQYMHLITDVNLLTMAQKDYVAGLTQNIQKHNDALKLDKEALEKAKAEVEEMTKAADRNSVLNGDSEEKVDTVTAAVDDLTGSFAGYNKILQAIADGQAKATEGLTAMADGAQETRDRVAELEETIISTTQEERDRVVETGYQVVSSFEEQKEAADDLADAFQRVADVGRHFGTALAEGDTRGAVLGLIADLLPLLETYAITAAAKAFVMGNPAEGAFWIGVAGAALIGDIFTNKAIADYNKEQSRGAASGTDFVVPPGYPDDSYPMRVQSGEHVQVTPAGASAMGEPVRLQVYFDNRIFFDVVTKGTRDRQILIDRRSIT